MIRTTNLPDHVAFLARTDRYVVRGVWRGRNLRHSEWAKTTRVYGALDALVPELMALEPFTDLAIPLSSPARSVEDNVRAAMWKAWQRETVKVGADRLVDLLRTAFATDVDGDTAYPVPTERPKFSTTAGCSCPCSPGFILDVRIAEAGHPIDLWIEECLPE